MAQDYGYQYVTNTDELRAVDNRPVLGLFAPTTMK